MTDQLKFYSAMSASNKERAMDFFEDPENKHCWGQCSVDNECEGTVRPVLVFSDGSKGMMDCGPDGMPFFYCEAAIEADEKTGFRVEIQR